MKKCPKCNRNIPSDANICPYCGSPQPGYRPTRQIPNNRKSMYLYYLFAIVLIVMPMLLSYLFAFHTLNSDSAVSSETITLAPYTESSREQVEYQYDSLSDFSKKVTNSDSYVSKIEAVEKQLNELVPNDEFEKNYSFQITQNSNVYVFAEYEIVAKTNEVYQIEYSYDLSGENQWRMVVSDKNISSVDDIDELLVGRQETLNQMIEVFNGKDNSQLLKKSSDEFLAMKESLMNETISHYGKGVSQSDGDDMCAIRIFRYDDTYRLKMTFETQLKKKNFM